MHDSSIMEIVQGLEDLLDNFGQFFFRYDLMIPCETEDIISLNILSDDVIEAFFQEDVIKVVNVGMVKLFE